MSQQVVNRVSQGVRCGVLYGLFIGCFASSTLLDRLMLVILAMYLCRGIAPCDAPDHFQLVGLFPGFGKRS